MKTVKTFARQFSFSLMLHLVAGLVEVVGRDTKLLRIECRFSCFVTMLDQQRHEFAENRPCAFPKTITVTPISEHDLSIFKSECVSYRKEKRSLPTRFTATSLSLMR